MSDAQKNQIELSSKERIRLIHQGNALFNQKRYMMAEKVFRTVQYQDGLNRLGDFYFQEGQYFRSAELFRLARNLKGEYRCYLQLGLIKDIDDFHQNHLKKAMDEQINKKIASVIQKMIEKP